MTELAVPEQSTIATTNHAAPVQQRQLSELERWAENARVVSAIAVSISKTSFAGPLLGKPQEVTAVILAGDELGFKPMAALKAFDIIQGTPALRAHAMRALVMTHGHEVQLLESTPEKAVYRGRRKGGAESDWQHVTWTLARAKDLGLLGKAEWKKQPQTMLVARATGEICRLIASDALHGVPYAAEELDGYAHGEVAPARAPLNIAAITAPPALPAPTTAEPEQSVGQAHEQDSDDTEWQQEPDEPTDWPAAAQPGGAE